VKRYASKSEKYNNVNIFKIGGRHRWKSELKYSFWNAYVWYQKTRFQQNILIRIGMVSIVDRILIKLP